MDPYPDREADGGSGSPVGIAEIERWTYEIESPFRPAHELAELTGEAGGAEQAFALQEEAGGAQPTLRRGSRGDAVRSLQQALNGAGARLTADGIFGAATEAAVRAFQSANGLSADGIVGPQTWGRLVAPGVAAATPAPLPVGGSGSGVPADAPATPLGTLTLNAPNRSFTYPFTQQDLIWTAKLIVHEAGGQENTDNAAVLWAMFNHYAFFRHRQYPSFTAFIRAYSTTLQPTLVNWRAAERHYQSPAFVRSGGTYTKAPHIPRGQLQRHLDVQAAPWSRVKESARRMALRALRGELPNPGIGNANEFASTRVLFRQRHKREPTTEEWREFTLGYARLKKLRWIGEVPGLNQMKNAFFITASIASVPAGAVSIQPPASVTPYLPADEEAAYPGPEAEDEGPEDEEFSDEALEEEGADAYGALEAIDAQYETGDQVSGAEYEADFEEEQEEEEEIEAFDTTAEDSLFEEEAEEEGWSQAEAVEESAFLEEVSRTSSTYLRWLQQALNAVAGERLAVDGVTGPRTRDAVRRFQASRQLTVDGIVGPQTERALVAAGAPAPPAAAGATAVQPAPARSGGTSQATSASCRARRPTGSGSLVVAGREFSPPAGLVVANWADPQVRQFTHPPRAQCRTPSAVSSFVLHETQGSIPWKPFRRDFLNDTRKLSVHLYADVDGRIIQHNDLVEVTWHGSQYNRASIGIEIVAPVLPSIVETVRRQAANLTFPLSRQLGLEPYRTITTTWMQRRRDNPSHAYVLPPIDQVEGVAKLIGWLTDPSVGHGLAIPRRWVGEQAAGAFTLRGASFTTPQPGVIGHAQFKNTKDDGLFAAVYCWLRLQAQGGRGLSQADAYAAATQLLTTGGGGGSDPNVIDLSRYR